MFKKAKSETQLGISSQANSFLTGKSAKIYENADEWHNIFRNQVLMRIDESICNHYLPNTQVRPILQYVC